MKNLLVGIFLFMVSQVYAFDWQDSPVIGKLFNSSNVKGTFVLYDPGANRFIGHDRVRAGTRFIPASTFKIPNSLIGLSSGAVKSVDEVLPYGGKPQPIKAWEHDMGLREAIKISNVPIYQELARRIGSILILQMIYLTCI
jgi:beta-lactamase class D